MLIIFTLYYHLKYINLEIDSRSHNGDRGYEILITAFATAYLRKYAVRNRRNEHTTFPRFFQERPNET